MSFLYPLGLLGLIGIPILIIIYIIKSKFAEQTVASTYLWTLSERFLKKKKRNSKLTGIISLILQILAIIIISLTIAHPVITIPDTANEYCFILDATGSMNVEQTEGKTRYDIGKEKIAEIIDESNDGSLYTLLHVGNGTNVIYEKIDNKERATLLLNDTNVAYRDTEIIDAVDKAQQYFNENKGILTYLVTDKAYNSIQNVELINVAESKDNYSLIVSSHEYVPSLNTLKVKGTLTSFESDATLTLQLFVNGADTASTTENISVKKGEATKFEISCECKKFNSARVKLLEEDSLMLDNENIIYNVDSENSYKTLIVSDTPFFLRTVLETIGGADITEYSVEEYKALEKDKSKDITGFGLYIFHSYAPQAMPNDGSVWFINVDESVADSGFKMQGEVTLDLGDTLEMTKSSASIVKKLTKELSGKDIYISKYMKYGLYRNFTTLFSYEGNPMVFTGVNTYGNREVVFAFDLHTSDIALLADYVILVRNLLEYSFPAALDETSFYCGETADINVIANCESIRVDSPLNNIIHLNTNGAVSELELNEIGTYTITMMVSGAPRQYYVYSALPEDERAPMVVEEEQIGITGEPSGEGLDGIFDDLLIYFICLFVIFMADWMVYCYEKYQLR